MNALSITMKSAAVCLAAASLSVFSVGARAADGCKFLLCIAGPWASIAECRPTVHEVFRDLAMGRGLPTCDMSGEGNRAANQWVTEETCPPMYRHYGGDGLFQSCTYPAVVDVYVEGQLWSQVFFNFRGDSVTWYSDTALDSLTQPGGAPLDLSFYNDVSAWNSPQVAQCTSGGGTPVYGNYGAYISCNFPGGGGGGGEG